jgi:hypothetical protein
LLPGWKATVLSRTAPASVAVVLALMPLLAAGQAPSIEGRWYGSLRTEHGDLHCWVSDRRPDGTYRTDFLTEDSGESVRYIEGGRWAQSPTAFLTLVETKDGSPVDRRLLEYAIIELTRETLVYRHVESGTRLDTRRVAGDFQLPGQCGIR